MQKQFIVASIILLAACSDNENSKHDATQPDAGRDLGQDLRSDMQSDAGADTSVDATADAQLADLAGEDQTPGDAGELSCEEIGFIGACDGDSVLWCLSDEIFPYDCKNPALDYAGPDRTCGLQDCLDEAAGCKGYFCVVQEGKPCNPLLPEEPALCDAAKDGCLNGVCAPSPACDAATYVEHCDGEFFTYCRYRVQNVDCTVGGTAPYTCGLSSKGAATCLGLEGGGCNLAKGLECVPGLVCRLGVCGQP